MNTAADVAKEAADFVLLEKDLAVLEQGVSEGRRTFSNTLKYVFMATSANFGNMFSMAGASLFLSFLPLLPKQVLLTNLMTDFPEMTIASDNVDPEMVAVPRRWDIRLHSALHAGLRVAEFGLRLCHLWGAPARLARQPGRISDRMVHRVSGFGLAHRSCDPDPKAHISQRAELEAAHRDRARGRRGDRNPVHAAAGSARIRAHSSRLLWSFGGDLGLLCA